MHRLARIFLLGALAAAAPVHAQEGGRTLSGRMNALLRAVQEGERKEQIAAAFFPRRGDWTWYRTAVGAPGGARLGVWRFPASQTARALGGGPVCNSFDQGGGEFGPVRGALAMHLLNHPTAWKRVRGNRFVPPGAPARSPTFVEWRREDGAWVISAFGDETSWTPRVLGRLDAMFTRDTTAAPREPRYAAGEAWFVNNEPITVAGHRYLRYGLPRTLAPDEITPFGVLREIMVYREAGQTEPVPEVVYLATAPGEYQPYQGFFRPPCR